MQALASSPAPPHSLGSRPNFVAVFSVPRHSGAIRPTSQSARMVTANELRELQSLERALAPAGGGKDAESADFGTRVKYLRLVRKLQLRRSAPVAYHGVALLNDVSSRRRLGEEVYDVLEQVAVAAMDINSFDVAKECIGALMLKFKKSARVGRLEGMWLEAKGWWEQADRFYENLLQEHPQDQKVMKRQVAALKAQGKLLEAAQALRKYLETFQADFEAWRDLAELYLSLSMVRQAAFCQEELLLSSPANPIYNLQYAEILYTLGGMENLKAARSYYAAAIEYSAGENVRALWGVCLVDAALKQLSGKSSKSSKGEGSSDLADVAGEVLAQMYRCKCPQKQTVANAVLSRLATR